MTSFLFKAKKIFEKLRYVIFGGNFCQRWQISKTNNTIFFSILRRSMLWENKISFNLRIKRYTTRSNPSFFKTWKPCPTVDGTNAYDPTSSFNRAQKLRHDSLIVLASGHGAQKNQKKGPNDPAILIITRHSSLSLSLDSFPFTSFSFPFSCLPNENGAWEWGSVLVYIWRGEV